MRSEPLFVFFSVTSGCIEYQPNAEDPLQPPVFNPADPPVVSATDSYEQVDKPEVDILWVVDNSCSMGNEQDELAANFPGFMEYFLGSNLDYHIGVISTDTYADDENGKLIPGPGGILWIDPTTPDPVDAFAAMAVLGNGGGAPEKGIKATYNAFELQTEHNAGFFRDADDSDINIIVVSDESDYSGTEPVSIGEFEDYLNNKRADPDRVSFHGIVTPPPPAELCAGTASPGTRYVDVINAVGGVYWSLCSNDWIGALEAIGLQTAGLKREYFLTQRPVEGTIKVSVEYEGATQLFTEYDPASGLGDWTYSEPRNSVTFLEYIPASGAVVQVEYDVLSAAEHE